MPSGAEYKNKYWLTKTKPVIVKEVLRLIVSYAKLDKFNTELTRRLADTIHQRNALDNELIACTARLIKLREDYDREIHITRIKTMSGINEMNARLFDISKPKTTRWERIKNWFTKDKELLELFSIPL